MNISGAVWDCVGSFLNVADAGKIRFADEEYKRASLCENRLQLRQHLGTARDRIQNGGWRDEREEERRGGGEGGGLEDWCDSTKGAEGRVKEESTGAFSRGGNGRSAAKSGSGAHTTNRYEKPAYVGRENSRRRDRARMRKKSGRSSRGAAIKLARAFRAPVHIGLFVPRSAPIKHMTSAGDIGDGNFAGAALRHLTLLPTFLTVSSQHSLFVDVSLSTVGI